MKKKFTLCLFALSSYCFLQAQTPALQWENNYGGTQTETLNDMIPTSDGGYVMIGETSSHDNDIPANFHGGTDILVIKINSTGTIQWSRSIGGLDNEIGYSMVEDADGDIVLVAEAISNNQDFMSIPFSGGGKDIVVVSLNGDGTTEWLKRYGGSGDEGARSIQKDPAGGYIIAGYTNSPDDYDVSGMHYYGGTAETNDSWIIKLDNAGDLVWQKCFGGSQDETTFGAGQEIATSIQPSEAGGYIVAGYTNSADGDVTNPLGSNDYWLVKLNNLGAMVWQKTLGGSGDDMANTVVVVSDGYVISGTTSSANNDVTDNHSFGGVDGWIVKTDFNGNIVDSRSVGGSGSDYIYKISKTADNGFLLAGGSQSLADDCEGNSGLRDFWTVKLNASLDLVWKKNLGGGLMEEAVVCMESSSGGYIAAGYTENLNPFLSSGGTYGVADWWVVKLSEAVGIENQQNLQWNIYPNPTSNQLFISGIKKASTLQILNASGQVLTTANVNDENHMVDVSNYPKGIYFIQLSDEQNTRVEKLIIQ